MALMLSPEWGPYTDSNDARTCLGRFVDSACGPQPGIVWTANGTIYPLRAPRRNADGIGTILIFEWNKPPPPPKRPSTSWGRVKAFIRDALEAEQRAATLETQANLAIGQSMATVMTLPDIVYGGAKMIRELVEIKNLRTMDQATAQAATSMTVRTMNAARAERLQQIAARANLRAQLRSEQIAAALKLEATGREAVPLLWPS